MTFGLWTWVGQGSMCYMRCTLAQPGEYDWTVHVSRPCQKRRNRFRCCLGCRL